MKSDLVLAITLFALVVGVGLGMLWRSVQIEPVLHARIAYLEEERKDLRMQLVDYQVQIGLFQEKGKRK